MCYGGRDWPETPDTGMCCMGSAAGGASRCTCWAPVYNVEQAPLQEGLEARERPEPCPDCAYRGGSPERSGDPQAAADEEELDHLVWSGKPFYCHQGMRRPLRWEHPSGVVVEASELEYEPPLVGTRPFKADGTPADVCGGWAARRRVLAAQRSSMEDD